MNLEEDPESSLSGERVCIEGVLEEDFLQSWGLECKGVRQWLASVVNNRWSQGPLLRKQDAGHRSDWA